MNCKKYKLTNNENTLQYFSYQKCNDTIWNNQIKLLPGQTKTVKIIEGTFSSTGKISIEKEDDLPIITEPNNELLGRLHSVDVRDLNHLIKDKIPQTVPAITSKYWQDNIWSGDQGKTPMCVGYAWAHFIEDGPITHAGAHPVVSPITIYREAQKIDEWPGENYNGTSVRAGAKYLKNAGKIASYLWAYDLATLTNTVLNVGPVVVGTNWYYNMFFPDKNGLIKATGNLAGGHAYVINGVDTVKQQFKIKNSWGLGWGQQGHAYISFSDMTRLIKEQGEICLATEKIF
jgi:hypothetical protein